MLDELSVDDLKQRLHDKEQTVATLTEYLEQAATKLNNLQKQTAETKPTQAFDSEMVHRQMELVSQLQAAVEEWEELQAPVTFERIGTQLETLQQTIQEGLARQSPGMERGEYAPSSGSGSLITASLLSSPGEGEEGDGLNAWEALKAEMLNGEGVPAETEEEVHKIDLKEELDVLVNRPAEVDQSCHDREVWHEAVNTRENYMISLIRALRVVESRRRGSPDWESLTEAPAELREEVAQHATDLQQSLRNAEVELSIERARISRQESVIAQQRREIDKTLKQRGLAQTSPQSDSADTQQGRWMKFLGRGNEEAE